MYVVALGKRLVQEGHRVTIASHEEVSGDLLWWKEIRLTFLLQYQGWVMSHGLEYKCIGGSPTALMQLSVEHKMFSPGFFRESLGKVSNSQVRGDSCLTPVQRSRHELQSLAIGIRTSQSCPWQTRISVARRPWRVYQAFY